MIAMSLQHIADATGGKLYGDDITIKQVFTDSRAIDDLEQLPNSLFVALKGPHFDAHRFVNSVVSQGVTCVLVEELTDANCSQVVVENSRLALADIARQNRRISNARYVAITGSSGKTTVKEMVAAILAKAGKTKATEGNFNNDIGAPLTLLNIDESTEYGVIELGANRPGEVAFTADVTKPDVAMVNNITAAHLEGFGSIQGVATAKAEIYSALSDNGVAVVNADEPFSSHFDKNIGCKKLSYSMKEATDVYSTEIEILSDQSIRFVLNVVNDEKQLEKQHIELPLVGIHNVSNALAAASCCLALGIGLTDIANGLKDTPVVSGRLNVSMLSNNCRIIDDTYNANLSSMKAAIDLLSSYSPPTLLVVGDMGELGDLGRQCHEEIGAYAFDRGITKLYSCGVLSQFSQFAFRQKRLDKIENDSLENLDSVHFSNKNDLIKTIKDEAKSGVTILVKGSRSAHMEDIVNELKSRDSGRDNSTIHLETESNVAFLKGEQ